MGGIYLNIHGIFLHKYLMFTENCISKLIEILKQWKEKFNELSFDCK